MNTIKNSLTKFSTKKVVITIISIILAIIVIYFIFFKSSPAPVAESSQAKKTIEKKVSGNFITLSELSLTDEPIVLYGKTASKSQVDVYAESPAKITKIYASLGDYVNEGDIVVALDSSNEQSSLSQAQLNLTSAELGLEKTLAGARAEDRNIAEADLTIKKDALEKTQSDIEKQIDNLVIFLDGTLRNDIDDFYDHTEKDEYIYQPTLIYRLKSESDIEELEEERLELEKNFETFQANEDDYSATEKTENSIEITEDFSALAELLYTQSQEFLGLDDERNEVLENKTLAIKNAIDAQKDILKNLKNLQDTQKSALVISQNTLNKTLSGATNEDINLSQANIDIAQNSVSSAKIALSKKTLRSPISGQISEMSADIGKLASSGSPIFSVNNPLNIKIESSISTEQREHIQLGKEVVASGMKAKISAISPVANSETGSISFEAVFTEKVTALIAGNTVQVSIKKNNTEKAETLSLPLSSVFEEFGSYFIYVLGSDLSAQKNPVEFVKISGENILVNNTFTGEEKIIINARGISEGDSL